jgi:hypothetical protein
MAYCLRPDDEQWLLLHLGSAAASERAAAATIAGVIAEWSEAVFERLLEVLNDLDPRVSEAAMKSLTYARRQRRAMDLVRHVTVPPGPQSTNPWVLLNAALKVGDPGFTDGPWPAWSKELSRTAGRAMPALAKVMYRELKKERKKALDKARTDAKRRR